MITVRDCLLYLEQQGWSELIDSRWEENVIEELTNKFPYISDDIIKEVLPIVLVYIIIAGPNGSGKTSVTKKFLHHEWAKILLPNE